jgi:hypothetical protein
MDSSKRFSETLMIGVMCLLLVSLGVTGTLAWNEYKINEDLKGQENILEYNQCSNISLEDTSGCLRDYLSTFYNYTIRDDTIKTIEDIKENGGDCYDYNKLYERLGKELGFDTFTFRINMGEDYHRIAIISDKTGYCLLDQRQKAKCFRRGLYEE